MKKSRKIFQGKAYYSFWVIFSLMLFAIYLGAVGLIIRNTDLGIFTRISISLMITIVVVLGSIMCWKNIKNLVKLYDEYEELYGK